jgi:hypothetical protein
MTNKKIVKNENNGVPRNKAEDDATYPTSGERARLRKERENDLISEEEKHPSERPNTVSHPQVQE